MYKIENNGWMDIFNHRNNVWVYPWMIITTVAITTMTQNSDKKIKSQKWKLIKLFLHFLISDLVAPSIYITTIITTITIIISIITIIIKPINIYVCLKNAYIYIYIYIYIYSNMRTQWEKKSRINKELCMLQKI